MARTPAPTETAAGRVTVVVLRDGAPTRRLSFDSYPAAIAAVRERVDDAAAVKLVDADDEVVFSSARTDIEAWAVAFYRERDRRADRTRARECPYGNRSCTTQGRCARCLLA